MVWSRTLAGARVGFLGVASPQEKPRTHDGENDLP
jgi:hypothetical protein